MFSELEWWQVLEGIMVFLGIFSSCAAWVYYRLYKENVHKISFYLQCYRDYSSQAHRLERVSRRQKATIKHLEDKLKLYQEKQNES